ncbi:MAG: hypothetical protein JEZ02_22000 [Desulfatibacillum sp.]|nr:hypothetical protein [Desulfatibacillum sp.]
MVAPKRVHVDSFGFVHLCQGVCIGNMFEKPLSQIMAEFDAREHPICGPLVRGGPFELARVHGLDLDQEFVDECHCCFVVRRALRDKFPEFLAPPQVYGRM